MSAHKVSCVEKVSSLLDQYAALPNPNFGLLGPHLQTLGIFETTESTQIRNRALQLVEKAIQIGWHVPQDFILQSFGSYSLEVHTKNSDIDLLVVGNLPRKDFFNHVSKTFKSTADVQFLRLVKDAMVPIIKLIVLDIPIDLIYAQVHNSLKKKQISWTKLNLSDMDIPDARALSGYIDCITIKNLIPNIDKWRVLFQAVKYWAKKKGIYGNKLCYLGGFGWMILTTRICQMLPNASVENLFYNFFKFYAIWDWSKVPLTVLINAKPIEFNMGPGDCFVVVTVTSPHRNSARNVTQSTKKIIINEFQNAANYLENNQFAKIWEPVPFFSKYPSYLEIVCEAENLKDFLKWIGYLESRFVSLITEMEQVTKNRLITHIYPASFQSLETIQHPHSCTFFIGLEVIPDPNGEQARFSINEPIEKFQLLCYGWEGFSKSMLIQIKRTKREKIQNLNMKVVQVELLKVKAAPVQSDLAPSPSPSPSPSDATGAKKKFRTIQTAL
uniref:polynucleotide adenylyltransferase n=1 Tax=Arcella intermedia TaxID=1963864 RepID=A0A6B2L253_9EUKA